MTKWTTAQMPDQTGRVAVVTGANSGLGLEIARALAHHGTTVLLACRDVERGASAAQRIRRHHPEARLEVRRLDLADLASVRTFASELTSDHDRLDLLVNNAGLMAVDEARTVDGYEMQFGVNHLGHFALTAHLLPLLEKTPASRVGTMSSMGHRRGRMDFADLMPTGDRYRRWPAYFQSKLANLLFTAELHRRLTETGSSTVAVSAHPGASRTDLGVEGTSLTNRLIPYFVPWMAMPAAAGALPMLRAVTAPEVRGGTFYGPRFVFRGGGAVVETPSRRARDAEAAVRLWDISAELTGVEAVPRSRAAEAAAS